VPENKIRLDNLLKDFQSMKSHLAVVVEYGGTSGLVSLDVLIVGDISDEFDDEDINFFKSMIKNFV
jgi:Mg2+/Co2+ transporter CorC